MVITESHRERIESRLNDISLDKFPRGFWLNEDDLKKFWSTISDVSTREVERETAKDNVVTVNVTTYSCQGDLFIRVYGRTQVKTGASVGGAAGGLAGGAGGGLAGAAIGSLFLPIIGTAVGAVIGGLSGAIAGGALGSGGGAAVGAGVSNDQYSKVTAKEIFQGLPGYREHDKTVYCEL